MRVLFERYMQPVPIFIILISSMLLRAQTEVHLRAESRYFTRLPVLLKPCQLKEQAEQTLGKTVLDILEADLWYSSVIAPIRETAALAENGLATAASGTNPGGTPPRFSVETIVAVRGTHLFIRAGIVDLSTGKTIDELDSRGCTDNPRITVHVIADDIVKQLTGENGIAKSRIAFTTSFNQAKEIYILDYDGHNRNLVTRNHSLNLAPAWNAEGSRIVFTSYQQQNPDLFFFDLLSGRTIPLLQGRGLNTSAAVSPDGNKIAFVSTRDGNAEIYLMDINGGHVRRLTHHPAIETSPFWSPTGREIVFTSDRLGKPQLFVMDAEGSNIHRLPIDLEYSDSPSWSPRGDKIAFVSRIPGGFDIFSFDIPGQAVTRLTDNAGSNEDPYWSPDGFHLAFSSTRDGGKRDIYTMMWDGTDVRRLTFTGNCSSPAWSPNRRPAEKMGCFDSQ